MIEQVDSVSCMHRKFHNKSSKYGSIPLPQPHLDKAPMVEGWRDPQVAATIEPFPERTLAPAFLVGESYPQGLPDQESKGTS